MPLKTVLENLEGVDDAFKPLYKEVDKKFILDVEGVDDHPAVRNLKNAFEAQKKANGEIREKLLPLETKVAELPEDFDPAKWIEFKALAADHAKDRNAKDTEVQNLTALHNSRIEALTAAHKKEVEDRDRLIAERDTRLDRQALDSELTDLLVKARVSDGLMRAARLVIANRVKIERLEDGNRKNVVETDLGPLSLKDYVDTWSQSDEGKPFLAKATGIDAQGGLARGSGNKITRLDFDRLPNDQKVATAAKAAKGELQIVD